MNDFKLELPNNVEEAIGILYAGGFEAYAVGGCVRDLLMGLTPNDWDLAASSTPDETKACFKGYKTYDTGIGHGTVTVMCGSPLEITTFRVERGYADHRRPDSVCFSRRVEDDLSRRDFTVNSMAYNHMRGLIDPFSGRKDLETRLIKAVGEAEQRFSEDALRILRGLRFASCLGFSIEEQTSAAILKKARDLNFVSRERIGSEFKKLITGQDAHQILNDYKSVFFTLMPMLRVIENTEQNTPYHSMDVWNHTLAAVKNTPPRLALRLAALFHDCGKGVTRSTDKNGVDHFYGHAKESVGIAGEILQSLRFDKGTSAHVLWLIEHHDERLPLSQRRIKKLLNAVPEDWVTDLICLMKADNLSKNKSVAEERMPLFIDAMNMIKKINEEDQCFKLCDLAVKGNDLIAIGFKPGRELGAALEALLESVMGGTPNNRSALLDIAGKLLTMYQGRN